MNEEDLLIDRNSQLQNTQFHYFPRILLGPVELLGLNFVLFEHFSGQGASSEA
ncbi:hypothetical protein [Parashewanella curva]|uniref:hypothetical protein n=1 Tax=Parashewanella curva TaxID=2338552 RepID=UPI00140445D3|nr:hypothetical protein [Parashewanella curva]